jgi:hypothetical protein
MLCDLLLFGAAAHLHLRAAHRAGSHSPFVDLLLLAEKLDGTAQRNKHEAKDNRNSALPCLLLLLLRAVGHALLLWDLCLDLLVQQPLNTALMAGSRPAHTSPLVW